MPQDVAFCPIDLIYIRAMLVEEEAALLRGTSEVTTEVKERTSVVNPALPYARDLRRLRFYWNIIPHHQLLKMTAHECKEN
ncbi:hypothetical protein [Evansella tamaricis]|uniref:Uncharacterized protein n=1 Tax=Evansella tamaricis TaxID=2069301 RepID=A0ABS6JL71_9BACI|nr:hypothetical protein [Evansella tamaricis]MBU9713949.1 hypothetical protein [Evansella tamaricis]